MAKLIDIEKPEYKDKISENSDQPDYHEKKRLKELQRINLDSSYLVELQDEFLNEMKV